VNRIVFLVDGFNLYHSLLDARRDLRGRGTRWLDLAAFCGSFLHQIGGRAELAGIHYFSALPTHLEELEPGVVSRHLGYIECLEATGVTAELGRFKERVLHCPNCAAPIRRHEEKETDVAIAVRLLERLASGECEAAVLVSGDSDLAPAIREARRAFPRQPVIGCLPYRRDSFVLRDLVTTTLRVKAERYSRHQFPDPFILPSGRVRWRPPGW
jgi:uncharacterized LabA/DUF88 family protein